MIQTKLEESVRTRDGVQTTTAGNGRRFCGAESAKRQYVVPVVVDSEPAAGQPEEPVVVARTPSTAPHVTDSAETPTVGTPRQSSDSGSATRPAMVPGSTSPPATTDTATEAAVNPFTIPVDYESRQAADLVATYLGGTVVGNHVGMDLTPISGLPVDIWTVNVGGRNYDARFLAKTLNESTPDRLRIDLNEVGISVLGAAPLASKVAYESNYARDPNARDPGPLPAWATPA
ncbi:MAG: hypothetical protein ABI693_23475 [Bryobacteraceae bacterium]